MKCKLLSTLIAAFAVFTASQSYANTLTYQLKNFSAGGYYSPDADPVAISVSGHIITDGTIGDLALSDILAYDFQFKITDKYGTTTHGFDNMSNVNWNTAYGFWGRLTARMTAGQEGLYFDFSVPDSYPDHNIIEVDGQGLDGAWSTFTLQGLFGTTAGLFLSSTNYGGGLYLGVYLPMSGDQKIASLIKPKVTPLPAALPLFATGLGGLGLLGWRRKRRAQAVA